jgi:hypothetical protein
MIVAGDTAGWLAPCGCTTRQSGGLARRATLVAQARTEGAVLVADVGGAVAGHAAYDRLKLAAILEGERAMGVAAHNLGAAEAALEPDSLRRLIAEERVPLISANLRSADGTRVAEPLRLVTAAGRRVALVGVLSPRYAGPWRVDPPRDAVLEALRTVAGRFDHLIVLAYLPVDELRELAASLPEADVVCGGPTGQPLPPQPIGPVLLASATNMGKFVARFDIAAGSRGWKGRIVELDERFADDRAQLENLARFRGELARLDLTPAQTAFRPLSLAVPPPDYRLAGNAACRECHVEDCKLWEQSRHARAWQSLERGRAQPDPACQRCHTTGYGLPGGFASVRRTPDRVQVGCESCHGPSQAHVTDAKRPTTYHGRAQDQCLACHDRENSPKFQYAAYWGTIRHGRRDTPRPTPNSVSETQP